MSILVDEARWPWRGRRWAHLVSDRSLAELHAFADELGLRRIAFQGDHYDLDAERREQAVALGARPVEGRELVRRLRASGLRLAAPDRPGPWQPLLECRWPAWPHHRRAVPSVRLAERLDRLADHVGASARLTVLARPGSVAALVTTPTAPARPLPADVRRTAEDGRVVLELLEPAS